jgi:hypothetical protein
MSYSIAGQAATKQEALDILSAKMKEVVSQQPIHAADFEQALATAKAFVAIIPEPHVDQDVYISLSGSVSWINGHQDDPASIVTVASVNASASLTVKK